MAHTTTNKASSSRVFAGGLFFFYFFLNTFLVSPYIGWYDEGEMVGTTICLGISHPSGQAIYHLLGKVFLLLPEGTPAFKLGLLSDLCGALALALFYLLGLRLVEKWGGLKSPSAVHDSLKISLLLFSLAWGLSGPWWKVSTSVEVYSLHLSFGLGVLFLLTLEKPFKWPLVFFWVGIATVFRPTQCLVLPFIGILFLKDIFVKGRKGKPKALVLTFVAFLLGRMTVLYLPLRSALAPSLAFSDLAHPWPLVKHVLGLGFSKFVGTATIDSILTTLWNVAQRLWSDVTPIGVFLLLGGLVILVREPRKVPIFLWVGLAWGALEALLIFAVPYPAFEPHQTLLAWSGAGLLGVLSLGWLHGKFQGEPRKKWLLWSVLILLVAVQLSSIGERILDRKDREAEDFAKNLLEMMGPSALYVPAEENEYFPVVGIQQATGLRKDIETVRPGIPLERSAALVRKALEANRPVYLTREWEGLPAGFRCQRQGPLLKVTQDPAWEMVPGTPWAKPIASWGGVELKQVTFDPMETVQGGRVEISFDWARSRSGPQDGAQWVSILFADAEGNFFSRDGVIWLHDIHRPFGGVLPFASMKAGKVYREKEVLLIPSDYPPGEYRVMGALEKTSGPAKDQRRDPTGSFYEEAGRQGIGKFSGRVEGTGVLHFKAISEGSGEDDFWPVEGSTLRPFNKSFVPLVKLRIRARTD